MRSTPRSVSSSRARKGSHTRSKARWKVTCMGRAAAITLAVASLISALSTYASLTGSSPLGTDPRTILIHLYVDTILFLVLGAVWLLLDLTLLYRTRSYTRREFQLFGLALNVAGFASITWVWWNGSLA